MKRLSQVGTAILGCGLLLSVPVVATGQTVPIQGVTGTVALQGTVDQEYGAANTVVVKTVDGVKHVFHFTKDLLVHGGNGTGVDALQGLREGTTVVVHYTVADAVESAHEIDRIGGDGLKAAEGVVTRVERGRKEITIRFDNGRRETFRLTDRAAADVGKDLDRAAPDTTKVVVYYSDEGSQKVAHFFRKTS